MAIDENDMILDFVEKPADPPAMPGKPDARARQHGHLHLQRRLPVRAARARHRRPGSSHDFGKDIIPTAVRERPGGGASVLDSAASATTPEAEPYWRDVGTIDAYWDANIDLTATVPAARPVRPATGRSGPTRSSCRRPSSCTTRTTGAAWRSSRWSRAAASSRARVRRLGAVLERARAFVLPRSTGRCCCPTCRSARRAADARSSSTAAA